MNDKFNIQSKNNINNINKLNNNCTKNENNKLVNSFNNNNNNNNSKNCQFIRPNSAVNFNNSTRYFNPNKTSTHNFFKDTKVDSCSHIIETKGRTIAVPFKITNSKGRPLSAYKYTNNQTLPKKTIYKKDYDVKKVEHVGMVKKPLSLYHPNAYRSRLPISNIYMNHKNQSLISIGQSHAINNKQWLSTNRDSYKWPKPTPITNPGILSDKAKLVHKKLVSHQ